MTDQSISPELKPEKITVSQELLEKLFALEFERGKKEGIAQGMQEKTSLEFGDDCSSNAAVYLLRAKSRRALSRMVAERNHRNDTGCGADCTGRAFAWSCDLLRAYREGREWVGVCVGRVYFDI